MNGHKLLKGLSLRKSIFLMSDAKSKYSQFTVLVEGNIGSGKTTFLETFKDSDALILAEPVEKWKKVKEHNLLGLMYEDPTRWGLVFQSYVQLTMLDMHTQHSEHPMKLMERSIYSARYCFVENLKQSGSLHDAEYVVLDEWFKWITLNMDLHADLIVYLRTTPEIVHQRIIERGREEEGGVSLKYLEKLHTLHENWLYHRTIYSCPAPVLVLEANQQLDIVKEEYQRCKIKINEQCKSKSNVLTRENISLLP